MTRRLHAWASRLSAAAAVLSAMLLVYMVGHTLLEIALRNLFARSTFVLDEFVGYGMAAMTFLSLGHALERGQLIRVGILLARLGPRARQVVELACILLTLAVTLFAAWHFWGITARQWRRGAVSHSLAEVPLWIPYAIVLAGLAILALQLTAYLLHTLAGGRPYDPADEAGPRTS